MSFYYESTDLDLRKNLTALNYEELKDDSYGQVYDEQQSSIPVDQMLVVEHQTLLDDVKNMCTYFHLKYCYDMIQEDQIEKLNNFPFEKVKNRFCHILEKYQEQSSLLDSFLEQLVTPLANVVKIYVHKKVSQYLADKSNDLKLVEHFHTMTDTLYIISKVRGVRHISRYFPHEVRDLEPVVFILQHGAKENAADRNLHWESKYVLLLWLSVIVLVPFNLSTIDSNLFVGIPEEIASEQLRGSILLCLVNLGVHYLRSSTKLRNAGALFLSKLFSRPDVLKGSTILQDFIEWAVRTVQQLEDDCIHAFFVTGVLETLVEVLKTGQRNELRPYLVKLVPLISQGSKGNSLINLFVTKLSQRVGLVYLRARVVSWAYEKGNQNLAGSLNANLDYSKLVTNTKVQHSSQTSSETPVSLILETQVADYFADVDQGALEAVVDNLLVGLTNKDTIVRWSAAKGVGRLCARLELEQADDVFQSLLDTCFTPVQGDTAWHGGCLALGELCRRGLILETRLPQVVPIVCRALVFEQNQGGYSVGVNVRDSACYVAWSAARAYEPSVLLPYLPALSQTLAVVMLFDREVNVRRAASSTFQELVGRCPNVIAHGIEILSESDYFALALRHNAYLKVAPFVAAFREYYPPLLDHLAFVKVQSQDKEVRKLASKALSRLAQINVSYLLQNRVIEGLLVTVESPIINSKHGALYALGDLLVALSGRIDSTWEEKDLKDSVFLRTLTQNERQLAKAGEHISKFKSRFNELLRVNNIGSLSIQLLEKIIAVPGYIEDQKLLRGKAGELLRVAVCRLIECISLAKLPLLTKQHDIFIALIDDCIKNPLEESQISAVRALASLSLTYHKEFEIDGVKYLDKLLNDLNSPNKLLLKCGIAQAIGAFSANILHQRSAQVVQSLCKVGLSVKRSSVHTDMSLDPDTRKFAVKSLGLVLSSLLQNRLEVKDELLLQALNFLLHSMQDYTMNKRGDVGLYIREQSIIAIQQILSAYVDGVQQNVLDALMTERIVGCLLQQLMEKIDRVRLVAGSVLQELFKNVFPKLPPFQNYQLAAQIFSTSNLQKAMTEDQDRVDMTFQSEVIAAEVKHLKEILANIRQSELVYHWNLPHCCYRLVVPLMSAHNLMYSLFKGLCVSVGGISESIQKYSEEALRDFIGTHPEHLAQLFQTSLQLMQIHEKDERVLCPLFKTLAFLLQIEDVQQHPSSKQYAQPLFQQVRLETKGSEAIKKVNESVPVVIELMSIIPQSIGQECIDCIQEYLSCDLPIVRKQAADKLYLFLMSYEDEDIITIDNNMELQDYLLQIDWLDNKFERQIVKSMLEKFFKKE